MKGLITDRTQRNVYYRKELSAKGFTAMTLAEKAEWLADPLEAVGANLFSYGPYYSSAVEVKYRSEEIVATSTADGIYLYAISIIGEAVNYINKVFTLSVDAIIASGGGSPQIALYWHDDNGYEYAGADLLSAGSVTFDTSVIPNTNNRRYLAAYIYVTTHAAVTRGESARFVGVMLENGATLMFHSRSFWRPRQPRVRTIIRISTAWNVPFLKFQTTWVSVCIPEPIGACGISRRKPI